MLFASVIVLGALVAAGCPGKDVDKVTEIDAAVRDFSITLAESSAPAGKIKFDVENLAEHQEHEFEIFRSDIAADVLPVKDEKVDKEAPGLDKVVEKHVKGGKSIKLTADLRPGSYVIICNIRGHYQKGMHAAFEVK